MCISLIYQVKQLKDKLQAERGSDYLAENQKLIYAGWFCLNFTCINMIVKINKKVHILYTIMYILLGWGHTSILNMRITTDV